MPKIHLIEHNGTEHVIDAEVGVSIMQNAVDNLIPGIVGDCGGCCSCATCHGYINGQWAEKVNPKSEEEADMLEGALHVQDNSRLTCQIKVTEDMDGMVIHLPVSQF